MPEEAWWLESDSCASAPWLADYIKEFQRSRIKWTPFVYWQRKPMSGPYIHVDEQGRRRTASPEGVTCPGPEIVVAMYGGSTMWGEGVRDEYTVPSEVQRLLREAGINARVVNEGEGGYVSTQEMIKFQLRLRDEPAPDAVVFMDGLNDIYSLWENHKAGVTQNESNRYKDFNLAGNPIRMGLMILKGGHRGWSIFRFLQQKIRRPGSAPGADPATHTEEWARDVWHVYEENARMVRAIAEPRKIPALFFWQPSVYAKRTVTPFEERVRQAGPVPLQDLYRRTYSIASEACARNPGLGIYDISGCFDEIPEARFVDFFHLNERGNAEVAQRIVEQLLPALRGPAAPVPTPRTPGP